MSPPIAHRPLAAKRIPTRNPSQWSRSVLSAGGFPPADMQTHQMRMTTHRMRITHKTLCCVFFSLIWVAGSWGEGEQGAHLAMCVCSKVFLWILTWGMCMGRWPGGLGVCVCTHPGGGQLPWGALLAWWPWGFLGAPRGFIFFFKTFAFYDWSSSII